MSGFSSGPIFTMPIQYATPTTGQTVTITGGVGVLLINPAGTLVALTVALPSSPADGQSIEIGSSQAITTLTVSNGTIIGTLTTLALGGYAKFRWSATASLWFRVG